ncbi:MAG: hypothetical protein ALAOOOJD_01275 [bacterium]|nr:hypothetical protein [bacterium]
MLGTTISHYPAFCRCTAFRKVERDPEQRDKIIEKLGESGMSSLIKNHKKLTPSAGSSFIEKNNKLVLSGERRRV